MNILLSIKPKYANAILNGSKCYELRKSGFKRRDEIELVYMYATAPVKKILGTFTIKAIHEGHPKALWETLKTEEGFPKST